MKRNTDLKINHFNICPPFIRRLASINNSQIIRSIMLLIIIKYFDLSQV